MESATCSKIDTNITLILPKKAKAFHTSKFMGDEIYKIKAKKRTFVDGNIKQILRRRLKN